MTMDQIVVPAPWAEPFRLLHWGKGSGVPEVNLEHGGKTMQTVHPSALGGQIESPLVVLPVYKEVENQVMTNILEGRPRGICVFGHPGTGKSTCLWYLLIAMLRRGQAVLWVWGTTDDMILFTPDGCQVPTMTFLKRRTKHVPMVILYDARAGPIDPRLWTGSSGEAKRQNHLVLASSPRTARFRDWMKHGTDSITVDTLTREEVAWLVQDNPKKWAKPAHCHDVLTMYDYLGPSLNTLLEERVPKGLDTVEQDFQAHCEAMRESHPRPETELWIVQADCFTEFNTIRPVDEPTHYHSIFRVCSIDDPTSFYRFSSGPRYAVRLTTAFMAGFFFQSIHYKSFAEQLRDATRFSKVSRVRALFFGLSSIRFLSWSASLSQILMPKQETSVQVSNPVYHDLSVPPQVPTAYDMLDLKPESPPTPQVLHVAPVGSATLDALYEAEGGTKYLFQMTIAMRHGISQQGIDQVLACYSTATHKAGLEEFILVFVVPDEETGEKYLKQYANGKDFKVGGKIQALRVGVLIIDTSQIVTLEERTTEHLQVAPYTVDRYGKRMLDLQDIVGGELPSAAGSPSRHQMSTSSYKGSTQADWEAILEALPPLQSSSRTSWGRAPAVPTIISAANVQRAPPQSPVTKAPFTSPAASTGSLASSLKRSTALTGPSDRKGKSRKTVADEPTSSSAPPSSKALRAKKE